MDKSDGAAKSGRPQGREARPKSRIRHRIAGCIMAAGLVITALGSNVPAAQAWSASSNGCTGTVQVPRVEGYSMSDGTAAVTFADRYAWRSPCYSNSYHVITITTRIWQHNGYQWYLHLKRVSSTKVAPGAQGAWLGGFHQWVNLRSYNSLDVLVEWRTDSGFFLGSVYIDYNAIADYACHGCWVGTDPTVGAFLLT